MKMSDYSKVQTLTNDNVFLLDGIDGTKGILAPDLAKALQNFLKGDLPPAEMHRMMFRGKNLGTAITTAQKDAIRNGSFDDLYVGDYWVLNGVNWRIADINYWWNSGDTAFTKHHLVIMPDTQLYTAQMNTTNITTGGYVGSLMYTANLAQAKTLVANAFGDMVLTHRELLTNAVVNGRPSGHAWYDSTVELPNEVMMYGSYIMSPTGDGTVVSYLHTVCKQQLALCAMVPKFINPHRQNQWLRDVVSAAIFADVGSGGRAGNSGASTSYGVRPVVAVG